MKTIAIIPARGGSKRLKDKNIKVLNGLPLLVHSIRYAQQHPELIDAIYVSTNDSAIKRVAQEYGALVIDRPEALSDDFATTISVLKHVLENVSETVEHVVLLQPTNPLRPETLLPEAMQRYLTGNFDSLFTVSRNHQKLGKIIDDQFVPYNYEIGQRSQDLEPLYFENGLLYLLKSDLVKNGKIIGDHSFPFIVDNPFSEVDIDTQADFDYAAYLMGLK
ncbi:N-acylneuraminate cytidylyltransferase [Flavobacterium sp. 103]|uniref:acylneuraminate cytidylyltransferase family protein n=1 Tax=unclassified Flavobacterium TaxID=196869 RepID=UPI000D5CA094|nr:MULTISPECIES: acylneuraminate cytidylyltransferase family protein [unclassified Flavobacterium]PVX46625.1 N-acylneuraminate cytidylyltransferase [Flavobacterium sp. 103]QKJ64797.1 acylneuraminate cytidylyltransferase family protein [Flavobacterium sp. M31R6]